MPATPPTFDLQSHSFQSDGELSPGDVVRTAAHAGVDLLALTDHDTVEGVAEASAAADELGIELVAAVEVSTIDHDGRDLHVLGYRLDPDDLTLRDRLREYREQREQRAHAMAQAIVELGFQLDREELEQRRAQGRAIGRPHLAVAVVKHPANAPRLQQERRSEPSAFLEAYLLEGAPAFRPRTAPSVTEAIDLIHRAGGVAVWAHPFWDIAQSGDVVTAIDRFRASGIDGVECFYPTHDREQAELLADQCERLGLLSTGSSDFHGPGHREFSRFRGFSTYGREPALGPIGR